MIVTFMKRLVFVPLLAVLFMGQGPAGPGRGPVRDPRQEPTGTGVIRGRIVAADTSTPIRRAQVRATSGGGRGRLVSTDTEGRFELRDMPAGRWEISASKAGFVTLRFGQRRPFEAGRPIELANAQTLDGITIALPRGAAITGRVFDEFGDPIAGARVQVLRYQLVQGERQLMPTANAGVSDDTGAFRVYGLMPGDYYVSATLRAVVDDPDDNATYAPTYYPGTGSVTDAQRVSIGLAQEQGNINFALMPVRAVRISGTVLDSTGVPLSGGAIALLPSDSMIRIGGFGGGNRIGGDGRFSLANVAPGSYTITATAGRPRGADMEVASMPLFVSGEDMTGLTLITSTGTSLSGRVVAAAGVATSLPSGNVQVGVAQFRSGRGIPSRPVRMAADGTFELTNLFGQGFIRINGLPQDWMLTSVSVNGTDVTDTPIEFRPNEEIRGVQVAVTNRVTELAGTVMGADGKPVRDYTVVVFPDDETKWTAPSRFIRAARPDQQGLFKIRALPANGRYLAVAVDYLEEGEANDPEFLASAKDSGTRVALTEGESKAIELKLLQR